MGRIADRQLMQKRPFRLWAAADWRFSDVEIRFADIRNATCQSTRETACRRYDATNFSTDGAITTCDWPPQAGSAASFIHAPAQHRFSSEVAVLESGR